MSERRACRVIDADRKSVRYRSIRDDDGALREKLRDLANQRRRFGYRRLHILLRRDGVMINRKKTQRLYREEGLAVRRRRSRRRAVGTRAPAPVLALPNQRWSLDFVHDQMASGRRFRVLNVVDDVTRECLAAVPDTSISGHRVVRELTRLIEERGKPGMIVSGVEDGQWPQWHRAHQQCRARVVRPERRGVALHRSGQADAERIRREVGLRPASLPMAACATSFSTRPCS